MTIKNIIFILNFLKRNNPTKNTITAGTLIVVKLTFSDLKSARIIIIENADAIRPAVAERRPLSMYATFCESSNFLKNLYINTLSNTPVKTQPNVANTDPITPPIFKPTNVDKFIANGPGVICEIAIMLVNSLNLIQ